jgi:hypothetical protein
MGMLAALAIGYVLGAKAGSKDIDQVTHALRALSRSDEFADVVAAVRSHVGHTLREIGGMIEGSPSTSEVDTGDLVERVRHLFGRG